MGRRPWRRGGKDGRRKEGGQESDHAMRWTTASRSGIINGVTSLTAAGGSMLVRRGGSMVVRANTTNPIGR